MQWTLEGHSHVFSAITSSSFEIKIVYKISDLYLYWVTYFLMLYNPVTPSCRNLSHFNENSILTSLSVNFTSLVNKIWMNDWIEIWMTEEKKWHFWTKKKLVFFLRTHRLPEVLGKVRYLESFWHDWGEVPGLLRQLTPVPPLKTLCCPCVTFNLVLR